MALVRYKLNRPIHLARRDGFLEKAESVFFHQCVKGRKPEKRFESLRIVEYYLTSALEHALLAAKASEMCVDEESLIYFMRFILGYLDSSVMIMESQSQFKNPDSRMLKFIRMAENNNPKTEGHFGKSGDHLLADISSLLEIVKKILPKMRQEEFAAMNDVNTARYKSAYESLLKHVVSSTHKRHNAIMRGRTSYPFLSMKYG